MYKLRQRYNTIKSCYNIRWRNLTVLLLWPRTSQPLLTTNENVRFWWQAGSNKLYLGKLASALNCWRLNSLFVLFVIFGRWRHCRCQRRCCVLSSFFCLSFQLDYLTETFPNFKASKLVDGQILGSWKTSIHAFSGSCVVKSKVGFCSNATK